MEDQMFNDSFVLSKLKTPNAWSTDLVFEIRNYDCNCHNIGKNSLCHISISKSQSNCMNCCTMLSAVKFIFALY